MKKLIVFAALAALAGCVGPSVDSVEPVLARLDDPNPFANYDEAMASDPDRPMAVEWQGAHLEEIEAATACGELSKIVASEESALAFLAKVRDGYATDPLTAIQIAAISQMVMSPKCAACPEAANCRAIWAGALLKSAQFAASAYRKLFFLDQLRWCGRAEDAAAIRELGTLSGDKGVNDFAAFVARELESAK